MEQAAGRAGASAAGSSASAAGSAKHFDAATRRKAEDLVSLYPERRSALVPLCHLAQSVDGWLCPDAIREIADLVGISPAEVLGTATFYDLLHTEPVGRHVVSVCTNVACLLRGGEDLLAHAKTSLGVNAGGTDADGQFTLEEVECLAACDRAPCVQVNGRFFGPLAPDDFDSLISDLRDGKLDDVVPSHGVLSRVPRDVGLAAGMSGARTSAGATPGSGSEDRS